MNAKTHLLEAKYWYITRPIKKWSLDLIWKLPRQVVYWCVVRAACKVEPNTYPGDVTAIQMMEAFGERSK